MAFFSKGLLYKRIRDELNSKGFCHVDEPLPERVFNAITFDLGSVIRREDVRLGASGRLVHQAEPIRFHTDQPYADILAWYCVESDLGAPTVLLDADAILSRFAPEKLRILQRAVAFYPNPDDLSDVNPEPVLRIEDGYINLYFITFRGARSVASEVKEVWEEFVSFVESEGPKHAFEVALRKDECLFLHNKSFLHGRGPLNPGTSRCLRRIWIRSNQVRRLPFAAYPGLEDGIVSSPPLETVHASRPLQSPVH